MLKFKDYEYKRPDIEKYKADVNEQLEIFVSADHPEKQIQIMKEIAKQDKEIDSMLELCYIRNTIDTTDKFYDEEMAYMDEAAPELEAIKSKYYKTILKSKFRANLEKEFGSLLFKKAENQIQTFDDCILEDLKKRK